MSAIDTARIEQILKGVADWMKWRQLERIGLEALAKKDPRLLRSDHIRDERRKDLKEQLAKQEAAEIALIQDYNDKAMDALFGVAGTRSRPTEPSVMFNAPSLAEAMQQAWVGPADVLHDPTDLLAFIDCVAGGRGPDHAYSIWNRLKLQLQRLLMAGKPRAVDGDPCEELKTHLKTFTDKRSQKGPLQKPAQNCLNAVEHCPHPVDEVGTNTRDFLAQKLYPLVPEAAECFILSDRKVRFNRELYLLNFKSGPSTL